MNDRCQLYRQPGQQNLTAPRGHPKVYGTDQIHYLRGRVCRTEFSERKNTSLWNTKVQEAKAISVGEHLAKGGSSKGTQLTQQ